MPPEYIDIPFERFNPPFAATHNIERDTYDKMVAQHRVCVHAKVKLIYLIANDVAQEIAANIEDILDPDTRLRIIQRMVLRGLKELR